ncbi:hypothetical protein ACJMK2_027560, partial [Sinanodonta woodiana]
AFGYFECTHDITSYCKAKPFEYTGKKTPLAVRFSTVGGESGSADTARDARGFAVKFYTEDGIWDLVGINSPIFPIRDPMLFPSFIHTQKRNPQTHLKCQDAVDQNKLDMVSEDAVDQNKLDTVSGCCRPEQVGYGVMML